jgi:carbon monoxide dehydrogenase subunit G
MASSIHSAITINRPIEDVFAVLTNVENTGKWFPGDVKEWWTSPPPHGVGSTRRARVKMGLMTTENDAVATVFEPPHRAGMKGTSKNAPFEAMLEFEPVEGGTRVESNIELDIRGPAKLLGGMFTRWYGRSWDQGLVNLKRMMEAGEL